MLTSTMTFFPAIANSSTSPGCISSPHLLPSRSIPSLLILPGRVESVCRTVRSLRRLSAASALPIAEAVVAIGVPVKLMPRLLRLIPMPTLLSKPTKLEVGCGKASVFVMPVPFAFGLAKLIAGEPKLSAGVPNVKAGVLMPAILDGPIVSVLAADVFAAKVLLPGMVLPPTIVLPARLGVPIGRGVPFCAGLANVPWPPGVW